MKILAIGNAIVDILCQVDDEFLAQNNLIKGSMSLISEEMAKKLSELPTKKITSGGSACNTIATMAQLKTPAAFIGKVGDDEFGKKFIDEIHKTNIEFLGAKSCGKTTAKSFVLITPDAQRTMCTFLGCASEINENEVDEKAFLNTAILYLEGYLWDAPTTIAALKKAILCAKKHGAKIAFSLSDSFCVARHKSDFLELIKNDLDILFANEFEANELAPNFAEIFAHNPNLVIIVTKSEKGCEVFYQEKSEAKFIQKSLISPAKKITKLIDTTGAGDAFAAGFLQGLINELNLEKCANLGNFLASKIIQKLGARFENEEVF